ncbi:hypothetical protein J132_01221 [Termitomyces sp. J132]|nr:hypothetical protein J132_01221 [Termitomyces sp. J132]
MFMPPSNNEIITDNGPPILKAVTYLVKKYNLHHIQISGYNKHANGIVKQPHFDVCQALFKAVDSDQSRWSTATYSVFWSEQVTVHKQMGCSPYFMTTGTHPLLPANIAEVTYLQPPPNSLLSTTDLIACQAIDLQHCQEDLNHLHSHVLSTCRLAAIRFETEHAAMICDYNFKAGNFILMSVEIGLAWTISMSYLPIHFLIGQFLSHHQMWWQSVSTIKPYLFYQIFV